MVLLALDNRTLRRFSPRGLTYDSLTQNLGVFVDDYDTANNTGREDSRQAGHAQADAAPYSWVLKNLIAPKILHSTHPAHL